MQFFYNGSKYNYHFITKELAEFKKQFTCLHITFTVSIEKGLHRIKSKLGHDDKKYETCGIKYRYCNCFLEYTNFKDDLIEYKCLSCNENCQHKFNKKLKEQFFNTNNQFILLLRKGDYPYDYIDDWKKFNETSFPEKEDFYSHLNMEDITEFLKILE